MDNLIIQLYLHNEVLTKSLNLKAQVNFLGCQYQRLRLIPRGLYLLKWLKDSAPYNAFFSWRLPCNKCKYEHNRFPWVNEASYSIIEFEGDLGRLYCDSSCYMSNSQSHNTESCTNIIFDISVKIFLMKFIFKLLDLGLAILHNIGGIYAIKETS